MEYVNAYEGGVSAAVADYLAKELYLQEVSGSYVDQAVTGLDSILLTPNRDGTGPRGDGPRDDKGSRGGRGPRDGRGKGQGPRRGHSGDGKGQGTGGGKGDCGKGR